MTKFLKKYIWCFIISIILFILCIFFDFNDAIWNWILGFSSGIFSVPIIFLITDLFSEKRNERNQNEILSVLEDEVNRVLSKFLYFSQYFMEVYDEDVEIAGDLDTLNSLLKMSKGEIKDKVLKCEIPGFILFSFFNPFDKDIMNLLNTPLMSKYMSDDLNAILCNFSTKYNNFTSSFTNFGTTKDYPDIARFDNLEVRAISENYYKFFWIKEDNSLEQCYDTWVTVLNKEKHMWTYSFTEEQAERIANGLFDIYSSINLWIKYRNQNELKVNYKNICVIHGKLVFDIAMYIDELN